MGKAGLSARTVIRRTAGFAILFGFDCGRELLALRHRDGSQREQARGRIAARAPGGTCAPPGVAQVVNRIESSCLEALRADGWGRLDLGLQLLSSNLDLLENGREVTLLQAGCLRVGGRAREPKLGIPSAVSERGRCPTCSCSPHMASA